MAEFLWEKRKVTVTEDFISCRIIYIPLRYFFMGLYIIRQLHKDMYNFCNDQIIYMVF